MNESAHSKGSDAPVDPLLMVEGPTEIELAEFFGPPDFLLAAEQFDAENGAGAAAELMRLAKENSRG